MQILWCGFLLLPYFLCCVHPLECNSTYEYQYTQYSYVQCCKKCGPGERMEKRCTRDSNTECKPCSPDFYSDEYSIEMDCKRCTQCTKEYMVYKSKCARSTNAVCGCESGYKCNSLSCTECVKIPTPPPTSPPPLSPSPSPPSAVMSITKRDEQPTRHSQDIVWISLSLCCLCILLTCFILISRATPACGRIMFASAGFWGRSTKSSAESSQCTADEEVPMPVQEVCGYKEWHEEV